MKKRFIFNLIRSVVEVQISTTHFREYNINEIFLRYIFSMPDIEQVYNDSFKRLKSKASCFVTDYRLHERAKELTISLLNTMYK
jgi:hypothetical protein